MLLAYFSLLSCSLSVTKWIHLNWGDDGLITLFVKIWRLLRPVSICISVCWTFKIGRISVINRENTQFYRSSLFLQGGIFIMEPQPWTSYKRNRLVSEVGFSVQAYGQLAPNIFNFVLFLVYLVVMGSRLYLH